LKTHSTVGYSQPSFPSKEVCEEDIYAGPEKFPLSNVARIGGSFKGSFKAVYASKLFSVHRDSIVNLGGHSVAGGRVGFSNFTNFAVAHYHWRCAEIEAENNKRVVIRHEYVLPSDTTATAVNKLTKKLKCTADKLCGFKNNSCSPLTFSSFHKAVGHVQFLHCPELFKQEYYSSGKTKEFLLNHGFNDVLEISEQKFGL